MEIGENHIQLSLCDENGDDLNRKHIFHTRAILEVGTDAWDGGCVTRVVVLEAGGQEVECWVLEEPWDILKVVRKKEKGAK